MELGVGLGGRFSLRLEEVNREGMFVLHRGIEKEKQTRVC
jgi:hypothetical protein